MLRLLLLATMLTLPSMAAQADSPARPRTYEVTSPNGEFMAIADPKTRRGREPDAPAFAVFKINGDKRQPVWEAADTHSFGAYLSDDGEYVARPGDWPKGSKPSDSDRAIAFYKRDTLLKKYSTKFLIRDLSRVTPSVSHYKYAYSKRQLSGFIMELVTVDCLQYHFDMRSGEITNSTQLFYSADPTFGTVRCTEEQLQVEPPTEQLQVEPPPADELPVNRMESGAASKADKDSQGAPAEPSEKKQSKGCSVGAHGSDNRVYWAFVLLFAALFRRQRT